MWFETAFFYVALAGLELRDLNSSLVTVKIGMVLSVVVHMPIMTAEAEGSQIRVQSELYRVILVFKKKNEAAYLPF